jgi:hypothetical protein
VFTYYSASGSPSFTINGPGMPSREEKLLLANVGRILDARSNSDAAALLRSIPFGIMDATNDHADEFNVLYATVPLDRYEALRGLKGRAATYEFIAIVEVFQELNCYIRHVAVELDPGPEVVVSDEERARALTKAEVNRLVYKYIGVSTDGYLGDFSYPKHEQFYADLDLDIDPNDYKGTTRARFTDIISGSPPAMQARILEGVLERFPPGSSDIRTPDVAAELRLWIARLRGTSPVASPKMVYTSATVEAALADAEHLIGSRPAGNAVDRVHTALHGFLMWVCEDAGLPVPNDPTIVQLLRALREGHAAFTGNGARADDVQAVMKMMGSIGDHLNPVRNHASLAHPNDALLDDPEAMLVINTVRTLLHYVNAKLERAGAMLSA